jgi:hypothetical protein
MQPTELDVSRICASSCPSISRAAALRAAGAPPDGAGAVGELSTPFESAAGRRQADVQRTPSEDKSLELEVWVGSLGLARHLEDSANRDATAFEFDVLHVGRVEPDLGRRRKLCESGRRDAP